MADNKFLSAEPTAEYFSIDELISEVEQVFESQASSSDVEFYVNK